jgi:hypothetical protein
MSLYHLAKNFPTHDASLAYIADLTAVLERCADYFNDRSDIVDGPDGPRPNYEMALLSEIEKVL